MLHIIMRHAYAFECLPYFQVSLEKRPFFVMLKVSNVHYKNRKKNVKTKGKPADTSGK